MSNVKLGIFTLTALFKMRNDDAILDWRKADWGRNLMKIKKRDKKRIFGLFAQGKTPEQIVEILSGSQGQDGRLPIPESRVERLFEEYLMMPIWEKLQTTLMVSFVANRLHRLMDDISDLRIIDAMIADANDKTFLSLLDLKRKIKERMAKDCETEAGRPEAIDEESEYEFNRLCEKILGPNKT